MNYRTMIIEDEELTRLGLKNKLEKFAEIEIVDMAENGIEAVEKINSIKPDLIFLDIQMPGMNGFEVLQNIEFIPIIIFTTAYDEYALKAFETNSIDYLLKPVEEERLARAISKLEKISSKNGQNNNFDNKISALLRELKNNNDKLTRIHIKIGDEVIFVNTENIYFFKADNKYTTIFTYDDEYIINDTLAYMETKLPDKFVRIHRGYIVNTDHIKKLKKWFGGKYLAVMNDKKFTEIPVSRNSKDKLFSD
ncbi:MAG: LytTR family DNA-binding domain-containing protein [Candidatus Delongbacteria bacterium]